MGRTVRIEEMAAEIMRGLEEYADLATEDMKKAVKQAGSTVRKEIQQTAPKNTGAYAKSWRTKTTKETASTMEVTVYSPSKYMLAHLLEHGHAKRGGGRVSAKPHIAAAEEKGETELEREIEKALGG